MPTLVDSIRALATKCAQQDALNSQKNSVHLDAVNANTLTTMDVYYCTNNTLALNYPLAEDFFIYVIKNGNNIIQEAHSIDSEAIFSRKSTDNGSTWSTWTGIDASNIIIPNYGVSATSVGELGDAAVKNAVDANTLVVPGLYFCTDTTVALHYPTNIPYFVRVFRNGLRINQIAVARSGAAIFTRQSNDSGASWDGWQPIDLRSTSSRSVYVSKDGSDTNTGLSADSPVLTVNAALRIALGLSTTGRLTFCFGPGDWGDVTIYGIAFSASYIRVTDYAGNTATSDPGNMPRFGTLSLRDGVFSLGNVEANTLVLTNAQVMNQYYFIVGCVSLDRFSYFILENPYKIKFVSGLTNSCFQVGGQSILYLNSAVELENGLTNGIFLNAYRGAQLYIDNKFSYTGTFSGTKYGFRGDVAFACHSSKSLNSLPGTDGSGVYTLNGIPTGTVNLTDNQTIAGVKTLTSNPVIKNNGPTINLQQADITKGTNPSANQSVLVNMLDSAGVAATNRTGLLENKVTTAGLTSTSLYAYQFANGSSANAQLGVYCSADGNTKYAVAPEFRPNKDNTYSLGISSDRWSQLFAGTATINTSDEREKDNIDALPDAVLDAWGEVNFQQYQFKDAIAEKGENARLHSGVIAQRVMEVFAKYGLDATRYGLLCHNSWEAEDWNETIIDKEAVTETVKVIDKEAVFGTRQVEIIPAYTDEKGIEHPAEYQEETYTVSPEESHEEKHIMEPEISHIEHHHKDAGDRYGIRYEEAFCLEAAYQRRRADRMEARLAALEAKIA